MCVETTVKLAHREQFSSSLTVAKISILPLVPVNRLHRHFSLIVITVLHLNTLTHPSLTVRGNRPGKPVQLQEYEIKYLCTKAREIFITQPILLELEAPIKICGMAPETLLSYFLFTLDVFFHRWHSWSILRPPPTFWVRWLPARSQLLVLGWLRRSRKTVLRNHLSAPCL